MNPLPSILVSMDVMSLYTNILHNDGFGRAEIKGPLKNHYTNGRSCPVAHIDTEA